MLNNYGDEAATEILPPKNVDRDLFVGLWLDRSPHVVALQEDDPKLELKVKELYWIMASNLLKCRPVSRYAVWGLYSSTIVLFAIALVMNLLNPILEVYDRLEKHLLGWPA